MSSDSRSYEGATVRCVGDSRHVLGVTAVRDSEIPSLRPLRQPTPRWRGPKIRLSRLERRAESPVYERGCAGERKRQRNESAVTRLTSVTASAGMPARFAAAMIASGLGAS